MTHNPEHIQDAHELIFHYIYYRSPLGRKNITAHHFTHTYDILVPMSIGGSTRITLHVTMFGRVAMSVSARLG
jgi:hypothetical protein